MDFIGIRQWMVSGGTRLGRNWMRKAKKGYVEGNVEATRNGEGGQPCKGGVENGAAQKEREISSNRERRLILL